MEASTKQPQQQQRLASTICVRERELARARLQCTWNSAVRTVCYYCQPTGDHWDLLLNIYACTLSRRVAHTCFCFIDCDDCVADAREHRAQRMQMQCGCAAQMCGRCALSGRGLN